MNHSTLSLFKGYSDKSPSSVTLAEVINLVRESPVVRDHTEKHRYFLLQGNVVAARREKFSTPCFAVAVRFEGGKGQAHIHDWTGLCLADIDHIEEGRLEELRRKACADPHTLLVYVTIGGHGLRILFRIDGLGTDTRQNQKLYRQFFEQTNRYYAELLGCPCDLQCKNATRLSGLAYDPDVFFNPEAQPFHLEQPVTPKRTKGRPATCSLKTAVRAARRELEEEGIAYEPHHHNEYVMRMGYLLNAYGVPEADSARWAVETFPDYDGNPAAVIASCYAHTEDHGTRRPGKRHGTGGGATCSVKEIEEYLGTQGVFRHNLFTGQCEMAYVDRPDRSFSPLTDRDINTLWSRMNKEVGRTRQSDIYNVLNSEFVPTFHPLEEYLQGLPPWDGVTDHIARLADTVHVKGGQERFRKYFRKWFVGLVAGVLDPRNVNHQVLVLIGRQGSYKTTWFNYLLPLELQRYFQTRISANRTTKDDLFSLSEFILICLEEIDEMPAAALNQLKAIVTMDSINERAAYGRNKERRPHIASFCATGNNLTFLSDPSGNRRWLPFEVEHIDPPQENPIDYAGVYAQAWYLWKHHFRHWFNAEETDSLNAYNARFEAPNLEKELILEHFRPTRPGEEGIFVTTAYVLNRIRGNIQCTLSPTKIGMLMKELAFERVRKGALRGYKVYEYSYEEIQRNRRAHGRLGHGPEEEEGLDPVLL